MKQNEMNRNLWHIIALSALSLNCTAQAVSGSQEWGEKFNTANSKLVLRETGRSLSNGRTVVTYNLFASGLPPDAQYTLWTRLVGSEPQAAADALLNDEGKGGWPAPYREAIDAAATPCKKRQDRVTHISHYPHFAHPIGWSPTSRDLCDWHRASTSLGLGAPLLAGFARGGFVGHASCRMLISRMSVSLTPMLGMVSRKKM